MRISPDPDRFLELAAEHTVVPVWTEVLADLETPVSAFLKLVGDDHGFVFESVEHGERADQAHDRVGYPVVVGRGVGQVLDLSNDVVAEEPGETTEQRGQILDLRG